MIVRLAEPKDLAAVLEAIARSDSTDRTPETWSLNGMTAVIAEDEGRIVGLIPFESRRYALGPRRDLRIAWVSGAHVDTEYRRHGIGSRLDAFAAECFHNDFDALAAYRHDEGGEAFGWYARLGYRVAIPILSLKRSVRSAPTIPTDVLTTANDVAAAGDELFAQFEACHGGFGGYVRRDAGFWARMMRAHYYRAHNSYRLLRLADAGYALVGLTAMKDGVARAEILDWASASGSLRPIIAAVEADAAGLGLAEIRIQIASTDPLLVTLIDDGFVVRWRTNVILRLLDPVRLLTLAAPPLAAIETAAIGRIPLDGQGPETFLADTALQQLIIGRADPVAAWSEGTLVPMGSPEAAIKGLSEAFPMRVWRHFQVDYV